MPVILRNSDDDYWSNSQGWTEFRECATFFDDASQVWGMEGYTQTATVYEAGHNARRQLEDDNDGDSWGWAISWLFAICDTITFERADIYVPDEWGFRPSPLGSASADDSWKTEILQQLSNGQLAYVGKMLHRYTAILRKAGKDY